MITVMLQGGLGNQLFQICAALSLAHDLGQMCVFTDSRELGRGAETKRRTYWDTPLFAGLCTTDIGRYPWAICREPSFKYSPIGTVAGTHTMLLGYFQSPHYFERNKAVIWRQLLTQKLGTPRVDAISLHFRIGDYRRVEHVHPIMPIEYYTQAINYIIKHTPKGTHAQGSLPSGAARFVRVFGEKTDEAEIESKVAALKAEFPDLVFEMEPWEIPDWQQLIDMSQCAHHIIANSSFSWWGAYLDDSDAIVCYPETWFGPTVGHDTTDLFPSHWTKIQYQFSSNPLSL